MYKSASRHNKPIDMSISASVSGTCFGMLLILGQGALADDTSGILGKWVWSSGLGPAVIAANDVGSQHKVAGTYSLVDHPQHTSNFGSGDGSDAVFKDGQLSIRLKSGSTFELVLKKNQLVGDFTFSRDGSVRHVVFDKVPHN